MNSLPSQSGVDGQSTRFVPHLTIMVQSREKRKRSACSCAVALSGTSSNPEGVCAHAPCSLPCRATLLACIIASLEVHQSSDHAGDLESRGGLPIDRRPSPSYRRYRSCPRRHPGMRASQQNGQPREHECELRGPLPRSEAHNPASFGSVGLRTVGENQIRRSSGSANSFSNHRPPGW